MAESLSLEDLMKKLDDLPLPAPSNQNSNDIGTNEDKSLEEMMNDVVSKLDELPAPVPMSQPHEKGFNDEDKSLEEMMSNVVSKLDELPAPVPMSQPQEKSLNDEGLPGLHNLLNRVAENFEKTEKFKTENVSAKGQSDTLEDMLQTLRTNIKSGDWLSQNTADRWVKENPALAEEFKKAAQGHNNSS